MQRLSNTTKVVFDILGCYFWLQQLTLDLHFVDAAFLRNIQYLSATNKFRRDNIFYL